MTFFGCLFQARMWREYAMSWDLPEWHIKRRWVEKILRIPRAECVRRARVNCYLARRINRKKHPLYRAQAIEALEKDAPKDG